VRILLIHPEDSLEAGPWSAQPWHRIIDLGQGSSDLYHRLSVRYQCSVESIRSLGESFSPHANVRQLLASATGELLDEFGVDWWELSSLMLHRELEKVAYLRTVAADLRPGDEVYVSRPGFYDHAMQYLLSRRVNVFPAQKGKDGQLRRYARACRKFSPQKVLEIFWDKVDGGYQIRGRFSRRRAPCNHPVVLLPTAYGNASRTAVAYARTVPEIHFLLVATRSSGWLDSLPTNVTGAWLSEYAVLETRHRKKELTVLLRKWRQIYRRLEAIPEFMVLARAGSFDDFPEKLRQGLEIRDAWHRVLDCEPVESVLCADDSNPYTHIPLLLARQRQLPTLACHHGALDGRYLFKRLHADILLAKGRMEQDYLVRQCGVPASRVEIGAPGELPGPTRSLASARSVITFFSEAYEASSGRAIEFYRELLPPLANVARSNGRKLIVKLHPFESAVDRQKLLTSVLSREQQLVVSVVSGPLTEDLLNRTWFGVTVLSTAGMECALRGIPCFLAGWLEHWPYGYVEQFNRFGVGCVLRSPLEIETIPEILKTYRVPPNLKREVWQSISPERFEQILSNRKWLERLAAV
jgi:hypothetical protein